MKKRDIPNIEYTLPGNDPTDEPNPGYFERFTDRIPPLFKSPLFNYALGGTILVLALNQIPSSSNLEGQLFETQSLGDVECFEEETCNAYGVPKLTVQKVVDADLIAYKPKDPNHCELLGSQTELLKSLESTEERKVRYANVLEIQKNTNCSN